MKYIQDGVHRYIAYVALCVKCGETINPHPRRTQKEAHDDLVKHRREHHKGRRKTKKAEEVNAHAGMADGR